MRVISCTHLKTSLIGITGHLDETKMGGVESAVCNVDGTFTLYSVERTPINKDMYYKSVFPTLLQRCSENAVRLDNVTLQNLVGLTPMHLNMCCFIVLGS